MMGLPSCREVTRLLSEELDSPAALRRPWRVRMHLIVCSACRLYERQIRWMRASMRAVAERLPLRMPPERRERIRRALRENK